MDPGDRKSENSGQEPADASRRELLELVDNCVLPAWVDQAGHKVTGKMLKHVLRAINSFGPRPYPAVASIARRAGMSDKNPKHTRRAIAGLIALGLLIVESSSRNGQRGQTTNHYVIVWQDLRAQRFQPPLRRAKKQVDPAPDQVDLVPDQSVLWADQVDPWVQESDKKLNEAPSFDVFGGPASADAGEVVDGARYFFSEELAAVRDKANRLNRWCCARTLADRELVLKISTLWNDGLLSHDSLEQVLESYQRKQAAGESLARPMGWLWHTLRSQCQRSNVRLEQLLASTDFPRELLTPSAKPTEVPCPSKPKP